MAQMKRTEFGKVDLDYVLGIGGFDLERLFSILWLLGFFYLKLPSYGVFIIPSIFLCCQDRECR